MGGEEITIRFANESDLQAAFRLVSDLGYPGLSLDQFIQTYHEVLEHPSMMLIVAEDRAGEVIGLASMTSRPQLRLASRLATIDEFVVAERARGRDVGRRLLDAAKALAHKSGASRLELETNRGRESYRRGFYVKNGFTEADSAVMRIDWQ